jgi:hypothetical protein
MDAKQTDGARLRPADSLAIWLETRLAGCIRDLRVESHEGRVVLLGRATTYHASQVAHQIALDATGTDVDNELVVC